MVLRHQTAKALHSIPKEAEAYLTEAGTKDHIINDLPKSATWKAKKLKLKYKEDVNKLVRDRWKEKAMHGELPKYLEKDYVDQEISFQWIKYTGLKGETEGLITAAQDRALNNIYYSKHIIKQGSTDRCRMCHTQVETVEHIISGCQTLCATASGYMQALCYQSGCTTLVPTQSRMSNGESEAGFPLFCTHKIPRIIFFFFNVASTYNWVSVYTLYVLLLHCFVYTTQKYAYLPLQPPIMTCITLKGGS